MKREAFVLYYAWRDPRTPRAAKLLAVCVAAYAFSPIGLIPDVLFAYRLVRGKGK